MAGRASPDASPPSLAEVAFYSVSDASAFVGVAGLINSLRLLGHDEPLLLLDCGLTPEQRALLEPHVRLVHGPPATHPALLKSWCPLAHPTEVMVLLDADIIVTRSLADLIEEARAGRLVVFQDDLGRFHPDWGELLGLGPLPRRPYVNSGHVVVPRALSHDVLGELQHALARLDLADALPRGGPPRTLSRSDPFFYTDQDALNAVLAARVATDRIVTLDSRLAPFPPFRGLTSDAMTLACRYEDGTAPYLLHHVGPKPWLSATLDSVYERLLRRLLLGSDVAVRVPEHLLPLRLRTGALARADRTRAHVQAFLHSRTRGRLGIRPRVEHFLAERRRRSTGRGRPAG